MREKKLTTYDIVSVGVMAAVCFATTVFLKITIPSPAGPTMLKAGNIFCLLAGLLFGGLRGGLAAGIGSGLYDLTDPLFVADAPLTFVRFFLMAFITGKLAHAGDRNGSDIKRNVIAASAGSLFSLAFYAVKSVVTLVLEGSAFSAAVAAASVKLTTSSFNAVIAVVVSVLIAPACRQALARAGVLQKIFPAKVG